MAKILLVDDSSLSRRVLRRILEGDGHVVVEASSGQEGLQAYRREAPDLVTLDNVMGDLSGLETMVQLRAIDPDARVILATADIQATTASQAAEAGVMRLISKPFNPDNVRSAVQEVLALCR